MTKVFLFGSAALLLTATAAQAQVSITFGEPAEPAYPVYSEPYWPSEHYDVHRHRHNDYWAQRHHGEYGRGYDVHSRDDHREHHAEEYR